MVARIIIETVIMVIGVTLVGFLLGKFLNKDKEWDEDQAEECKEAK